MIKGTELANQIMLEDHEHCSATLMDHKTIRHGSHYFGIRVYASNLISLTLFLSFLFFSVSLYFIVKNKNKQKKEKELVAEKKKTMFIISLASKEEEAKVLSCYFLCYNISMDFIWR